MISLAYDSAQCNLNGLTREHDDYIPFGPIVSFYMKFSHFSKRVMFFVDRFKSSLAEVNRFQGALFNPVGDDEQSKVCAGLV